MPTIPEQLDATKLAYANEAAAQQKVVDGANAIILALKDQLKAAQDALATRLANDTAKDAMKVKAVHLHTASGFKPVLNGVILDPITEPFSLRPETEAGALSVAFDVDGVRVRIENSSPWTMFSDSGGTGIDKVSLGTLPIGDHVVTMTAFSLKDGKGVAGVPATVVLRVAEKVKPPAQVPVSKPRRIPLTLEGAKFYDAAEGGNEISISVFVEVPA